MHLQWVRLFSVAVITLSLTLHRARAEDYWAPRGGPNTEAGRMKTIDQVEPRRVIPELPFDILTPGSYYLAGNLVSTSATFGIRIRSSDVVIDLNGFALIGAPGSMDGIRVDGTNENITIRNGSIREWEGFGINAPNADDASIWDIKSNRNGLGGILSGNGSMVARCTAYGNGYKAPLPETYTATNPDSDGDTMDDAWEMQIVNANPTDPFNDPDDVFPTTDFDMDGHNNLAEFNGGTDPTDPQSHPGPNILDVDFDGMDDQWEQIIIDVDPFDSIATNLDVWPWGLGMINGDFDNDGYENMTEYMGGTSPTNFFDVPTNTVQNEYGEWTEPPPAEEVEEFQDPEDETSDDGIRVGPFSTVMECKARNNRGSGICAQYGSRVIACTVGGNLTDGIRVTDYCTVIDCTCAKNRKDGIVVGSKCRVQDNNCGQNGDRQAPTAAMPRGAGIRILGAGNRIENNNVCGNVLGIQVDNTYAAEGMTAGQNLIIGNSSIDNFGMAFDLSTGDFMGGQMYQGDVNDPNNPNNATMDTDNPFSNFAF